MDSERSARARVALDGLSVGDAFGEVSAYGSDRVRHRVEMGIVGGPWWWTDDTAMALGIMECLERDGCIREETLAWIFARNFKRDPDRGYGLDQVADFALDLSAPRGDGLFPLAVFRCSSGRKFMQVALNLGYGCGGQKLCLDHAQQAIIDILTASRHACANGCATIFVRLRIRRTGDRPR